jgi:hypothetical protein
MVMLMSGRISASRSAAVKAAQVAKARRDALRLAHERMVESALADWFEGMAQAEELRQRAAARAAQLLADAEGAAAEPEATARRALRMLAGLGETRDQIAGLTGLTLTEVRAALTAAEAAAEQAPTSPHVGDEAAEPMKQTGSVVPSTGAAAAPSANHAEAATVPP